MSRLWSWIQFVWVGAMIIAPTQTVAQDRKWLPEPDEVARYADLTGNLFGNPYTVIASPRGGFVLDDWSDFSVREFSTAGELEWRFGRRGSGPGEFIRIMDMEFDSAGNLLVLDVDQGRVTAVSPSGELVETYQVFDAEQILPSTFHPGSWSVMPRLLSRQDTLRVSRANFASRSVARPTSLRYSHAQASEGWATNLMDGEAVVFFRWSSQIVTLGPQGNVRGVFDGIEPISFPDVVEQEVTPPAESGISAMRVVRIDPKAVTASIAASVHESRIYVLFAGRSSQARQIVDSYSMSGDYIGSYLLPHPVVSAAVLFDGQLATLETALIPTVRLWHLAR